MPIRYGRRSEIRQDTFTMVSSTSLNERQFGRAIAVPCRSQDLIDEAVRLWTAETRHGKNRRRRISKTWGCVGLLENPDRRIPDHVRNDWITKVHGESTYGQLQSAMGESPAVDKDGFLNIAWPRALDGGEIELNAILATATDPTLDDSGYALAKAVADAWKASSGEKEAHYFWNNRKNGIETFEDGEIVKLLNDGDCTSSEPFGQKGSDDVQECDKIRCLGKNL